MANLFQRLYHRDLKKAYAGFSGVVFDNVIGEIPDLQAYFENIKKTISPETNILVSYHDPLWEPALSLASLLGLRRRVGIQNWLDRGDLENILSLSGFDVISTKRRFWGITLITIAKPRRAKAKSIKSRYSVSIIIPARNEEGNIGRIIPSMPRFGKSQEFVFIEGWSKDKTWEKIEKLAANKRGLGKFRTVKAFKQRGKGKADAVYLGLRNATGQVTMIYDADRTVDAKDLPKFYKVLTSGFGDFANGSRLVYPVEGDAMRNLNKLGNQVFSWLFTWVLGQKFKDTLCGTKAFWRKDYLKHWRDYGKYLKTDPFGDFALIFTAVKHELKVIEIPVRYKERVYGSTNINRFYHGLLLLKMTLKAFWEFKIR